MRSHILTDALISATTAGAEPLPISSDDLKSTYLACERDAVEHHLSLEEIAHCSRIYEELKARLFDGDWRKLRIWSDLTLNPDRAA